MRSLLLLALTWVPLSAAHRVSKSGRCGPDYGLTCKSSTFGHCCSANSYCGRTKNHCGTGCRTGYGSCSVSPPAKVSTNARCGHAFYAWPAGMTCSGSKYGNCCSKFSLCGSTSAHCGTGCQPGFGSCAIASSPSPSAPGVPSPTPTPASSRQAPRIVNPSFEDDTSQPTPWIVNTNMAWTSSIQASGGYNSDRYFYATRNAGSSDLIPISITQNIVYIPNGATFDFVVSLRWFSLNIYNSQSPRVLVEIDGVAALNYNLNQDPDGSGWLTITSDIRTVVTGDVHTVSIKFTPVDANISAIGLDSISLRLEAGSPGLC